MSEKSDEDFELMCVLMAASLITHALGQLWWRHELH